MIWEMDTRGEYRFWVRAGGREGRQGGRLGLWSLLRKKEKNYAVFYFPGKFFFFYIYEEITIKFFPYGKKKRWYILLALVDKALVKTQKSPSKDSKDLSLDPSLDPKRALVKILKTPGKGSEEP